MREYFGSCLLASARKYSPSSGGAALKEKARVGLKSSRESEDWLSHHKAGVLFMTLSKDVIFLHF